MTVFFGEHQCVGVLGVDTATSLSDNVNSASYVEVTSSLATDVDAMLLTIRYCTETYDTQVDIGVGAASSETTIAEKLTFHGSGADARWHHSFLVPLSVAASNRLAIRAYRAGTSTAVSLYYQIHLFRKVGNTSPFTRCEYLGTAVLDGGGTAHTKGAYSEIVASTAADYKMLMMATSHVSSVAGDNDFLIDLAIGASSSEQIILPDYYVRTNAGNDMQNVLNPPTLPISIPAGTRLSGRCQNASTNTTYRKLQHYLWGIR